MENRYTMSKAAKELGVSKSTLFRWEKDGKISAPKRLARTNSRVYTDDDIKRIREWKDKLKDPPPPAKNGGRKKARP
jgi:excisionase family DNA binding protein